MRSIYLILSIVTLLFTGCCCPHNYIPNRDPPPPLQFRVPKKIKVALVLGSGGVRGMAHVGVLEELVNAGIDFDLIVGCSAGSIVGALYADSLDVEHVKDAVKRMKTQEVLDITLWDARFGLSQGNAMMRCLDNNLEARCFEELKKPFVAVATDLYAGELVPIGSGDIVKAVRASSSIPFVFVPVEMQGRILVDGGVINPVPVSVARNLGAEIVIAVDLSELLPKTFPTNLFGIASRSTEVAFLWQNSVCVRDADIIIRPKMCGVGTFNDKLKAQLYKAGKEAGREAIPKIKQLLACSQDEKPCSGYRWVQPMCLKPCEPAFDISYPNPWQYVDEDFEDFETTNRLEYAQNEQEEEMFPQ